MEIFRQWQGPIDAIFVPIGGGGLVAGIAAYVKRVRPEIKVIGVEPVDSDAMSRSLEAGRRVRLERVGLFADGVAVKEVGVETFRLCRELVDEIILVDTDAVCAAIKDVFEDTRSILEPAGALAIAGVKAYAEREKAKGETLVAVASGANMNFDRLRFVAERAEVGERREAILAVTIPEERGSFRRFCEPDRQPQRDRIQLPNSGPETRAHLRRLVDTRPRRHRGPAQGLARHGFEALDLSDDEFAKSHLRHMVGGSSALAEDELLYRFEFPERPGALMKFLTSMRPDWNISLFHYRNHGADVGRVSVGMQVPPEEMGEFRDFLDASTIATGTNRPTRPIDCSWPKGRDVTNPSDSARIDRMDKADQVLFDPGQVIFREGDPADCMYVLLTGEVELTKRGEHGKTMLRTVNQVNDFFGEMALIDGKPRSATATAITMTVLVSVDGATFENLLLTNGKFAVKIIKVLSERIRSANLQIQELADTDQRERILRGIADYSFKYGDSSGGGSRFVSIEEMKSWIDGHTGCAKDVIEATFSASVDNEGPGSGQSPCGRKRLGRRLERLPAVAGQAALGLRMMASAPS